MVNLVSREEGTLLQRSVCPSGRELDGALQGRRERVGSGVGLREAFAEEEGCLSGVWWDEKSPVR